MALLPFAVLVALAIRLLRPLIVVRVGALLSDQIGHFGPNTEIYLCERDAGMHAGTLDVFFHSSPICNPQLKKMWDRTLRTTQFARPVAIANRRLPGSAPHVIPFPSDVDPHRFLGRTTAHLAMTLDEERAGWAGIRALGVPDGAPFLCFHSRDDLYLSLAFPHLDLRYHQYRNVSVHEWMAGVDALVAQGYYAVRLGAAVAEPLARTSSHVIDYATSGRRSDFLDVFLCAKTSFFLGAAGGLNGLPRVFRRPVVCTNLIPYGRDHLLRVAGTRSLTIPKTLRVRASGHTLTFRETIEWRADDIIRGEQFEALGLDVINNTPEEMAMVALEMHERLTGAWQPAADDELLQRRFWSIFDLDDISDRELRVGAHFLRTHRDLLD